jgi:hypothetical protein
MEIINFRCTQQENNAVDYNIPDALYLVTLILQQTCASLRSYCPVESAETSRTAIKKTEVIV